MDIFGGLEKVSSLTWINRSKVLFHIADAPCHGARFHAANVGDDHPSGDPKGLKISELLKNICLF